MSHFPDVDRMAAVLEVWPGLFASKPVGMLPVRLDERRLLVLCQQPHLVEFLAGNGALIKALNRALDGETTVDSVEPVLATSTEIYLAGEVMALKLWLRDFDVGF